ncbi:MAG: hypothetical protein Kow0013_18590 [Pararhodobacter sp.]
MVLEAPRRAGRSVVAALVRRELWAARCGPAVAVQAGKEPVAMLILTGDRVTALDIGNRALTEDTLDSLCPGVLARFRAAAADLEAREG